MPKKLAHGTFLVMVVAALMIGGDMVEEGKRQMWHDTATVTTATLEDKAPEDAGDAARLDVAKLSLVGTCSHGGRDY